MQLKTIPPIHVLYFETKTSLNELSDYVRIVAQKLYRDAIQNDMEVTGPIYWLYEGADGKPETVFTLTIALPVTPSPQNTSSEFQQKTLESFQCVSHELYGDWSGMMDAYGKIFSYIGAENKIPSGLSREIYFNLDFENLDRNITEIQVGILN